MAGVLVSIELLRELYEHKSAIVRALFAHLKTDALWVKDKMNTSHALLIASPETRASLDSVVANKQVSASIAKRASACL